MAMDGVVIQSRRTSTLLRPTGFWLLALVWLWVEWLLMLVPEWRFNPQYGYGWFAAALALYLMAERWMLRPPAMQPQRRGVVGVLFVLAAIVYFVARYIAEANPGWRLLQWVVGACAIGAVLGFLYLQGGRMWLRHFGFVVVFTAVAIPWPTWIERTVVQSLMHGVAWMTVEGVGWLGVPALQSGNVIVTGGELLGIDEACSGVRSLQASLMAGLFLGEYYRFGVGRRCWLVVLAVLLAVILNVGRSVWMVLLAFHEGSGALDGWHDPAGIAVFLLLFAMLFGIAFLWHSRGRRTDGEQEVWRKSLRRKEDFRAFRWSASVWLPVFLILVLFGTRLAIRIGYGDPGRPVSDWTVAFPAIGVPVERIDIPPETRSLLRYDSARAASWTDKAEREWILYQFGWEAGAVSASLARMHGPEICLPSVGWSQVGIPGTFEHEVGGVRLAVRQYAFEAGGGRLVHVFHVIDDGTGLAAGDAGGYWTAGSRLRMALAGVRSSGARALTVAVEGAVDGDAARAALRALLDRSLVLEPGDSPAATATSAR